jgi:four helix bundle protein
MSRTFELNMRLIRFASDCIDMAESLPRSYAGTHIASQLIRSSSSPALHYGEAQAAESAADFIHKMKVCLKELRETYNCLLLIQVRKWVSNTDL